MPVSTEEVERLAQHYFLTPALVQEAAQLFSDYTDVEDGSSEGETTRTAEPRLSVQRLQQLLVALGAPLSHQDVVEILQVFSSTVLSVLPSTTAAAGAPSAGPGAVMGSAATSTSRLQNTSAATTLRKNNGVPNNNTTTNTTAANSNAAAGNASRHNTAPGTTRAQPSKDPRRTTSAPPATMAADEPGSADSADVAAGTSSPVFADSAGVSDNAVLFLGEEAQDGNASSSSAGAGRPASAVNLHGMTFPAFVYFLLVYPTLVQHVSKHAASAATVAATSALTPADVQELFAHVDGDGDGVWSVQDIRHAAEQCLTEDDGLLLEDADLCRLAEMHPVELQEALAEFDLDSDGVVTLEDIRQALQN